MDQVVTDRGGSLARLPATDARPHVIQLPWKFQTISKRASTITSSLSVSVQLQVIYVTMTNYYNTTVQLLIDTKYYNIDIVVCRYY